MLGAILLAGLVLRVLYLRELVDKPDFSVPAVDAGFHDCWARGLAGGDWRPPYGMSDPGIQRTPYLRPPGYPYFLSLIYGVFGHGYLAPRIVQMGLGLVSAALAYLFARRWFGRRVAIILAAFMSCYWAFIYFEGEFHAPVLAIYLLWLLVHVVGVWAERRNGLHALAVGVVVGVGALVRPNVLVCLPVVLMWAWWISGRRGRRRSFYPAALAMAAGTVLAVAPATIRNYRAAGDLVLISSNAGINLLVGNNENATGVVADRIADLGDFKTCYDYPELVRKLEHKLERTLKASEASAYFTTEALRFAREHPGDFIKLTLKKALLFWGPTEITHNKAIRWERAGSPTLRSIPGNFSVVVSLAAVGAGLLLANRRKARADGDGAPSSADREWEMSVLLAALILAYFLSVLPFFASARYRVPILPFLLLFAAYAVRNLGTFVATRELRRAVCWVAIGAMLYGLNVLVGRLMPVGGHDVAKWHYDRAVACGLSGRTDRAIDEYRVVLEHMPQNPHAHVGLGSCLARRGEVEPAVEHFNAALHIWPEYAEAHFNLGVAMAAKGRIDEAVARYTDAIRYHPEYVEAHFNLGALLAGMSRLDEAVSHYRAALHINPDFAPAHRNLGVVHFQRGMLDEAEGHFREVVRIQPADVESRCNLAIVLTHRGRLDEAIHEYQAALRIDPANATVQESLAELAALRRRPVPPRSGQ